MESLDGVSERGAIRLVQQIVPDLDDVVRTDPHEELIEYRVMEPAECEAIGHNRLSVGLRVRDDMRSVQELAVLQAAECTLVPIGS